MVSSRNQTEHSSNTLLALKQSALAKAKLLNLYWDAQAATEWAKPIVNSGVDLRAAIWALDDIFARENRVPGFSEVISAARNQGPKFIWLTISRKNVNSSTHTHARRVPADDCVEDHIRVGESFVSVTNAGSERLYRWHECDEGREFAKLFEKLSEQKVLQMPMDNAE
jgi:hypothetical protein